MKPLSQSFFSPRHHGNGTHQKYQETIIPGGYDEGKKHKHHEMQHFHPPSKTYLTPTLPDSYEEPAKHLDMEYLQIPSKSYLPPTLSDEYKQPKHTVKHTEMEYLQIPSKNYLPPTLTDEYKQPKHHKEKHLDMEYLQIPSKSYLPPTLADDYKKPGHKLKNVTIAPLRDSGFFSNGNVEIKALSKDYLGQGM